MHVKTNQTKAKFQHTGATKLENETFKYRKQAAITWGV